MKYNALITFIYAILILIGGFIGHYAGSIQSLISGLVFGILLFLCSLAMYMNKVTGYFAAIGLTIVLAAFFMARWIITSNFFPGGFLLITSFIVLVALLAIGIKKKSTVA